MPLGLMEAMASGIPVVATRVGGVVDLVAQGVSGWLVGDNDFEGFAWHTNHLIADAQARRAMGDAARRRVIDHFSLVESVSKTGALFERLCRTAPTLRSVAALVSARSPRFSDPAKATSSINIGPVT